MPPHASVPRDHSAALEQWLVLDLRARCARTTAVRATMLVRKRLSHKWGIVARAKIHASRLHLDPEAQLETCWTRALDLALVMGLVKMEGPWEMFKDRALGSKHANTLEKREQLGKLKTHAPGSILVFNLGTKEQQVMFKTHALTTLLVGT